MSQATLGSFLLNSLIKKIKVLLISSKKIIEGNFIERVSRFSALVHLGEKQEYVYLPNPGRLQELLIPKAKVILSLSKSNNRKTSYDLIMVYSNTHLISIDSRVPNKLVYESLQNREIIELTGYQEIRREVNYGNSRLDFYIHGPHTKALIEVKSVTLVKDSIAYFPDAVTTRGVRHIDELIKAKREGYDAFIIFVVQRDDAQAFSPNAVTDPSFAQSLRRAKNERVEILPYLCNVSLKEIKLYKKIPVYL